MDITIFPVATQLLHIPDGFLTLLVSLGSWFIALVTLVIALRAAQAQFDERLAPLAGVMAAFIFAGQMINFPVVGGTSGHLVGSTLAFIVLGPSLGLVSITAVIVLQALLFQDGGLVAMGANILVMGIVPGYIGYVIYRLMARLYAKRPLIGAGIGAWVSIMLAAFVTAVLLGLSGTTSMSIAVPAMLSIHALIGLGEALITVAALAALYRIRPDLADDSRPAEQRSLLGGLAIALAVVLLAPFASASPDGLESVAMQLGFLDRAQESSYQLFADYTIPALGETGLSTIVAGLVGLLVVAGLVFSLTRTMRRSS